MEIRFEDLPDSRNINLQIGMRIQLSCAAIATVVSLVLLAFGVLTLNQTLYIIGFSGVLTPFLWLMTRGHYRSTVIVQDDRLIVKTQAAVSGYPWGHIDSVAVHGRSQGTTTRRLLSLLRIPDVPYVEVRLNRGMRAGVLNKFGTDNMGIALPAKRLDLRVKDVRGLADAIAQRIAKPAA